jgi:four helix bundle protein
VQALDHERLDVYHLALDFLVFANSVIEGLPRGRSHLADQFTRASMSVVLNIAEGAGKVSKADKRRYYLTARGSATESAALLDVCLRLKLLDTAPYELGKEKVVPSSRCSSAWLRPAKNLALLQIRSQSIAQPSATTAA